MGVATRRLFGVSEKKVKFSELGIEAAEPVRLRLEEVGRSFLAGYHGALEEDGGGNRLAARIDALDPHQRGFAYEGTGLGLLVRDLLAPWRPRRLERFLAGPGASYVHLIHVGAGWSLGRLRLPVAFLRRRLDPLFGWLMLDGYGFYEGYFHPRRSLERRLRPRRLRGYELSVFDTGLGRSLWFRAAADPARIIARIARFPEARRADLWSGVGLAAAYAGGVDAGALQRLKLAAGPAQPALAQGTAFGAKARELSGHRLPVWTELAAEVLCGRSASSAAAVTDLELEALPAHDGAGGEPGERSRFAIWRRRIQHRLSGSGEAAGLPEPDDVADPGAPGPSSPERVEPGRAAT